ncbi:MAG: protein-L-isoaspartate O-methyltransferase [Hyphomicrobiales bacterium]
MARRSALDEAREAYAHDLARRSRATDPRVERMFELVPREAFLPPGPWLISGEGRLVETPDADPVHLYRNALVVLDHEKGINNGEPLLHAMWMVAAAPQPGETVTHIGAGAGYYTAILSMLVLPGGRVQAYEIDPALAAAARQNLQPFDNVAVLERDAVEADLEPSDLIYVNAGVVAPPAAWLRALQLGGRLIFPWRPSEQVGLTVMVTRGKRGFAAQALGGAWFIACAGASDRATAIRTPTSAEANSVRGVVLAENAAPDRTAVAVYPELWFSSELPQKPVDPRRPRAH